MTHAENYWARIAIAVACAGLVVGVRADDAVLTQPLATYDAASVAPAPQLDLTALEQLARARNPAVAQAEARIRALRGECLQVGLPPNPTAGYVGSEIGNEGAAGQQGGFVGQEFVTANKLGRNRAVVAAQIDAAEQELAAMQQRVVTDVRQAYYAALLAQRRLELADELVQVTTAATTASQALLDAQEIPRAGLLQTEVQAQSALVLRQTSANARDAAWRQLSAVVAADVTTVTLAGDVTQLPGLLVWEEQLTRLQFESPEVAAAAADVLRARRQLNRECVEAVPNITTQVAVQYDDATDYTVTSAQLGVPLPLWNRNQGGIARARAEVTQAQRNVERVEQELQRRLAAAFRRYSDARLTADSYATAILPRSQQTLELVRAGYEQGEVGYLDLLTAQQTYSQTNLAYLQALGELWDSYLLIDGLLLDDSLATPPTNG